MRFLTLLLLFSFGPALPAVASGMTVVAAGLGRSVEAAESNARENALRTALAALLPAEALVQHETRLRSGLLTGNTPCITGTAPLGEPVFVDGGLTAVSMRVDIAMPALAQELKKQGLIGATLDGESEAARWWTREESRDDAGKIMEEQVRHLPAGVLKAKADVDAAVHRLEGDRMRIEVPVLVEVDQQAYRLFVDTIRQSLTRMGMNPKVETFTLSPEQSLAPWKKSVGLSDKTDESFGLLALCELFSGKTGRWMLARVPAPVAAAFDRAAGVRVTVDLLDTAGQVVSSGDFDLARGADAPANIFAYSSFHKSVCIAPSLTSLAISGGVCTPGGPQKAIARKTIPFLLSMDELRRIATVRCGIANH